ncbi:MAG: DUF3604 domain-containing protein, partial [Holophagales bacterium]|nr:DUF3604 domain-containing protein [Holophagales bacterium]
DVDPPFDITEQRCRCRHYNPKKTALFGSTHLHTGLSFDASISFVDFWNPRYPGQLELGNNPRSAYRFAKGEGSIQLPQPSGVQRPGEPLGGGPSRSPTIDRPLDWGAVTDHAEFFGVMGICKGLIETEGGEAPPEHDSLECRMLNGFFYQPEDAVNPQFGQVMSGSSFTQLAMSSVSALSRNTGLPVCDNNPELCDAAEETTWAEVRGAAEEAYDRSSECTFTSLIGYENSSTPLGNTWHRNVIFRNDRVVRRPVTAIEMAINPNPDPTTEPVITRPDYVADTPENRERIAPAPVGRAYNHPLPQPFWNKLEESCTDENADTTPGLDGSCDFITIPHNTNLGGGSPPLFPSSFLSPFNAEDARRHQEMEPLVEIYQVKGSSECRYDPRFPGDNTTTDEQCAFEILDSTVGSRVPGSGSGVKPPNQIPPRAYVRNIWKDGMQIAATDPTMEGINPFKMGVVAGSDAHTGVLGWHPEDESWPGHAGIKDAYPMSDPTLIQYGTGGYSVVWAEENSRDAIFSALERKEAYGTSGTRIIARLFGGWDLPESACQQDFVSIGYENGVPMGGDLPEPPAADSKPSFLVHAARDQTNLAQIQIIKAWIDSQGEVHERVITVAGGDGETQVDPATCKAPEDAGHESLCSVWQDEDFDSEQHAFYYMRVLEEPVCRYSTLYCRKWYDLDPLDTRTCNNQLESLQAGNPVQKEIASRAAFCCSDESTEPFVQPVIQERAWTSPIWYEPATSTAGQGEGP